MKPRKIGFGYIFLVKTECIVLDMIQECKRKSFLLILTASRMTREQLFYEIINFVESK